MTDQLLYRTDPIKNIVVTEYDVGTLNIGFSMQLCIHLLIHAARVLIPSASFLFALDSVRSSEIATSKPRQIRHVSVHVG